jgi:hypothetical protein
MEKRVCFLLPKACILACVRYFDVTGPYAGLMGTSIVVTFPSYRGGSGILTGFWGRVAQVETRTRNIARSKSCPTRFNCGIAQILLSLQKNGIECLGYYPFFVFDADNGLSLFLFGRGIKALMLAVRIEAKKSTPRVISERQKNSLSPTTFHIANIEIVVPIMMQVRHTAKHIR